MNFRERLSVAVCIALHLIILCNLWQANKLTPRVVHVDMCGAL